MIDLTYLKNALNSLDEIIIRYDKENDDNAIRDAVIQRFEYTYSLSIKMLTRFLQNQANDLPDTLTFNETIRIANQMGLLLNNLEKWTDYRQKRNSSSHTYDEKIANEIVSIVKDFREDAKYLLNKLENNI
ncbi:MAG: nucleotidyltransferase substrate binding protein [Candidatus Gastranaerophilales bacterium]|nr:nucleotidyltransferase substrate binding protein [Candidatus Gastranaerophilales bacterium]